MKTDNDGCLGMLGALLVGAPITVALILADGFVLSRLWAWHAVPLGMALLPWTTFAVAALALSILRNRLKPSSPPDTDNKATQAAKAALFLAWPWVCLLVGWWLR